MTTNTARSRFAGTRFPWWVGAGAVNDERQASARLATAQPGTRFLCAVPPVRAVMAGSACLSEPTMGVVFMGHSLSARIRALEAELNRLKGAT